MALILAHPDKDQRLDEYVMDGASGRVAITSPDGEPLSLERANILLDMCKRLIMNLALPED
jgi:hypothetical protein